MSIGLLIFEVSRSHSDSSGRMIGPSQKPVPANKQHPQETDIPNPGGIRNRNPSKRTPVDPLLSAATGIDM